MVGFAGLTHLGIVSAVVSAARGFQVVGFHDDESLVSALHRGEIPVLEPNLSEILIQHRQRLTFSSDARSLAACDLIYITMDVPTNEYGESDLQPVRDIIAKVTTTMKDDALLVVQSQVPPGFTRTLPVEPRHLFYQVETLIFGSAVERAMNPERFILGCANPTEPLPSALNDYLRVFHCPILPMRYESAELAKISINMCLVASIGVANTMAEICEQIGADWSEIVPALRLDQRIGQYSYLRPGLGIAGGNLERDLATVLRLSKAYHTDAGVVSAWVANSNHRKNWAYNTLYQLVLKEKPDASIALLGLAYKENTRSTKNSPSLLLLEKLSSCKVTVYDPVVPASVVRGNVTGAGSAIEAANGADALLIITPWPEFKKISPTDLAMRMRGRTIIDPYRVLDKKAVLEAGFNYAALGMRPVMA
jgi:UDPglucose 6-dehydrogenase